MIRELLKVNERCTLFFIDKIENNFKIRVVNTFYGSFFLMTLCHIYNFICLITLLMQIL